MGRLATAAIVSMAMVVFLFLGVIVSLVVWYNSPVPIWWDIIGYLITLGIILPIPIALVLNIRDYLQKRR